MGHNLLTHTPSVDLPGISQAPADFPELSSTLIAGEGVSEGQIGVIRDGESQVYFALEQRNPGSNLRPISNPTALINSQQSNVTLFATNKQRHLAGGVLKNGNFLIVTVPTVPPYDVSFWIVSPHGVGVFRVTVIGQALGSGSGPALVAVTALAGGGFAIAFNGNGLPAFAIYSDLGAVIKSATLVGATGSMRHLSIASMANGSFVIAYNPTFGVAAFWVYGPTGDLVRAANISLSAAPNTMPTECRVAGLSGGGFVAVYAITTADAYKTYFQRFDNNGIPVGPEVLLRSIAPINDASILVEAFSSGGFFVAESFGVRTSVWSAAGAQIGLYAEQQPGINAQKMNCHAHGDIGVLAFLVNNGPLPASSSVRCQALYTTGPGNGSVIMANNASNSSNLYPICSSLPGGINLVMYEDNLGKAAIATFTGSYALIAQTSYQGFPFLFGRGVISFVSGQIKNDSPNMIMFGIDSGGSVYYVVINSSVPACRPVGVIKATAAKGQPVSVQWLGKAKLSTPFTRPFILPPNTAGSPDVQFRGRWTILGDTLVIED